MITFEGIPQIITESRKAFLRDLPELLEKRPGQWVAYGAGVRIDFDESSKTNLVQECLKRGHRRGSFVIFRIEPDVTPELDVVPDV